MFDIDVLGAVRTWEAAQPFLLEAAAKTGDAAFVIISSVSAVNAEQPSAYGAMKAALIHFAKGVGRANAPNKLRCNVISPGTVFDEDGPWGNVKRHAPAFFQQMLERNPTGRMATPQEIAAAALFLASPRSAFTTGCANMIVDGHTHHPAGELLAQPGGALGRAARERLSLGSSPMNDARTLCRG